MGGPDKNRTKNNARPSSSNRSANLLVSSGSFGTVAFSTPLFVPNSNLSTEFFLAFKKLNKKDVVTKTKALKELMALVNEKPANEVQDAFSAWINHYKPLTLHNVFKVRELTQACQGVFARVLGRNIAPSLKQVMPTWLLAQYDDHVTAHTHATAALTATFPGNKYTEALAYCKEEIAAFCLENILGNINDVIPRVDNEEDREPQYCRVLAGSMHALDHLARSLPASPHTDEWIWSNAHKLLEADVFWSRATHPDQGVRMALFCLLRGLVERFGSEFEGSLGKRACRVMFHNNEDKVNVAAAIWDCALQFICHVKNWASMVGKKGPFFNRMFVTLENGAWGEGRLLCPKIRLVFTGLDPALVEQQFYDRFFQALFTGLDKINTLNSKMERQCWVNMLSHCIQHLSHQTQDFAKASISVAIQYWLQRLLAPPEAAKFHKHFLTCSGEAITALLTHWHKNTSENKKKYDSYLQSFWNIVVLTSQRSIDNADEWEFDKIQYRIELQTILLQQLKYSFETGPKPERTVFYEGDEIAETPSPKKFNNDLFEKYMGYLKNTVETISARYFSLSEEKKACKVYLTALKPLLHEFDSERLFKAIAKRLEADSVYDLYERLVRKWFKANVTKCEVVVHVVFMMLPYMSPQEQDNALNSLTEMDSKVISWSLFTGVRRPNSDLLCVRRWFRSAAVERAVLGMVGEAAEQDTDSLVDTIIRCIIPIEGTREALLRNESVSRVVNEVTTIVMASTAEEEKPLDSCVSLASDVCDAVTSAGYLCENTTSVILDAHLELVYRMIRLNLRFLCDDERISVGSWERCRNSWHRGVSHLPASHRAALLQRAIEVLHKRIKSKRLESLNIPLIKHTASLCLYFPRQNERECSPSDIDDICHLTRTLFSDTSRDNSSVRDESSSPPQNHAPLEHYAYAYEGVNGNLSLSKELVKVTNWEKNDVTHLNKAQTVKECSRFLFRMLYMDNLLCNKVEAEDEAEVSWCNSLLADQRMREILMRLLYDTAVLTSLFQGYAFWEDCDILETSLSVADESLKSIMNEMSESSKCSVLAALREKGESEGFYWAMARRQFELRLDDKQTESKLAQKPFVDLVNDASYFHNLQVKTDVRWGGEGLFEARYITMLRTMYLTTVRRDASSAEFGERLVAMAQERPSTAPIHALLQYKEEALLLDTDVSDVEWAAIVSNVAVMQYLCSALQSSRPMETSQTEIFLAMRVLAGVLGSADRSKQHLRKLKVTMFIRAAMELFVCFRRWTQLGIVCEGDNNNTFTVLLSLCMVNVLSVAHHMLDRSRFITMSSALTAVIHHLSGAVELTDWLQVTAEHRRIDPGAVTRTACTVLSARNSHVYKILAYRVLVTLGRGMVQHDISNMHEFLSRREREEEAEEEPQPAVWPDLLRHDLNTTREYALLALKLNSESDRDRLVELCERDGSMAMVLGRLLLLGALHTVCAGVPRSSPVRHRYGEIIREERYVEQALEEGMPLLPPAVFEFALGPDSAEPPAHAHDFNTDPRISVQEPLRLGLLTCVACRNMCLALEGPGSGAARGWWSALRPRAARAIERIFKQYITPVLVNTHLQRVQDTHNQLPDLEVKVCWAQQEVQCAYELEEHTFELRVRFTGAYPLAVPQVTAAASTVNWMTLYLTYQGGLVSDAISMWVKAVDSRVNKSSVCYICYCRQHPSSGRLPKVLCHQCHNKFHSSCLRRWFTTSNKSSCPICRSQF